MRLPTEGHIPLPTDIVPVPPQGGTGVSIPDTDGLLCALEQVKGEAEITAAVVKAQQEEIRKARKHLAHTLVCRARLTGGCHPCRVADTWRKT